MKPRNKRGFTLLELIVVITIIGLLGTLVTVRVYPLLFQSKRTVALAGLRRIVEVADLIHTSTGDWPESLEEMVVRERRSERLGLDGTPIDPWGVEYLYELREDGPVAWTMGKDGEEGGEGENQDLYWPESEESP